MKKEEEKIELGEGGEGVEIARDGRGRMEEPLPVRLVAVGDVKMVGRTGEEEALTRFYVGMWGMERDGEGEGLAFWAENFRLVFEMREGLFERENMRTQGMEVMSLGEAAEKLMGAEIEYVRQRGVQAGSESILVQDPAGNWVEIFERREI